MKPVCLYFAGPVFRPRTEFGMELNRQITNRLVSYLYPEQLREWCSQVPDVPGNIILDSGAFSAWVKGHTIPLDEYITYAKEAEIIAADHNKKLRIVNVDVIPGEPGKSHHLNSINTRENRAEINKAAKQGYENLLRMKDAGITPIHVFHQGEDWEWLNKMVEHTDYIGISPANDMSMDARIEWMWSAFTYMHNHDIEVDTHGFAVWMIHILKNLPFTSTDLTALPLILPAGAKPTEALPVAPGQRLLDE